MDETILPSEIMSLTAVLQMIESERKTVTLTVKYEFENGIVMGKIYFENGLLIDAELKTEKGFIIGKEAFMNMVRFQKIRHKIFFSVRNYFSRKRQIQQGVAPLLIEAMYHEDSGKNSNLKPEVIPMINESLFNDLMSVSGVLAASIYSASGDVLLSRINDKGDYTEIEYIGPLAVEIYRKVKEISTKMNTGTPDFMSFETQRYTFVHRCVIPGVGAIGVLLNKTGNIGLTKLEILKICRTIAPEFKSLMQPVTVDFLPEN